MQEFEYLENGKSFLDEIIKHYSQILKSCHLVKNKKIDKKQRTQALKAMKNKVGTITKALLIQVTKEA